jgi:hypothetical protein
MILILCEEPLMSRFDPARTQLLLGDIERSTRGQMAGFQALDSPPPRLRLVADRLALVRLGVRLASAALTAQSRVAVNDIGVVDETGIERPLIDVALTDSPLPGTRPLPRFWAKWWRPFGAGLVVGWLLCTLICWMAS